MITITVTQYLHLFSVLIEMNIVLQIYTATCSRLTNGYIYKLREHVALPQFDQNFLINRLDFSTSCHNSGNGTLFHVLMICSFQVAIHMQCNFYFNRYSALEQMPYFAVTINKVAFTVNKVIVTIGSFRFYQWGQSVSINQRGPLLSICPKLINPISSIKWNPQWTHEAST